MVNGLFLSIWCFFYNICWYSLTTVSLIINWLLTLIINWWKSLSSWYYVLLILSIPSSYYLASRFVWEKSFLTALVFSHAVIWLIWNTPSLFHMPKEFKAHYSTTYIIRKVHCSVSKMAKSILERLVYDSKWLNLRISIC